MQLSLNASIKKKIKWILSGLVLIGVFNSCSTGETQFETPAGPRPGNQVGPWEILGVISKNTSSLKRDNADQLFKEDATVNVPPGTELIVPAVRGWSTGYGMTDPEDLSSQNSPAMTWHRADHNFGITLFNIEVKDINAVDNSTNPPTQTATIGIKLLLSDDNGDDEWWGDVNYTLICLGRRVVSGGDQ